MSVFVLEDVKVMTFIIIVIIPDRNLFVLYYCLFGADS